MSESLNITYEQAAKELTTVSINQFLKEPGPMI